MIERGWECHLVLEREPEEQSWIDALRSLGVVICCEPRPKRKLDPECIARVIRLCRKIPPDVFICENIHDNPLVGATLAGVPVRVWIKHAMNQSFEIGASQSLRNRLSISTRLSCALATRVIAVSGAVRDELIGLGICGGKILVRPNPRRLGNSHAPQCRAVMRTQFGLQPRDVVWVSVGHAVPVKGWDMLIRAFRPVVDSDPRAKLLLVGGVEGPEEVGTAAHLRAEIQRLDLQEKVSLTGQVEDISSLLRVCDAFVMSSRSEGFSIALIEALEAGLPCLATRVGIAPDVIRHGFNGMLVDRFNEKQMATALIEMTCDDSLRVRLAGNAVVPEMIPTLEDYALRMADDLAALRYNRSESVRNCCFRGSIIRLLQ